MNAAPVRFSALTRYTEPMPARRLIGTIIAATFATLIGASGAIAQTSPKAAMLEASAWDALEAAQYEKAASAFRDAIAGDRDNPQLHLGAALAAFALRRDAEARASL